MNSIDKSSSSCIEINADKLFTLPNGKIMYMNDTAESGLTKRYKSLPKLIGVAVTGTSIRSIALKRINDSGYLKMEAKKQENS